MMKEEEEGGYGEVGGGVQCREEKRSEGFEKMTSGVFLSFHVCLRGIFVFSQWSEKRRGKSVTWQ